MEIGRRGRKDEFGVELNDPSELVSYLKLNFPVVALDITDDDLKLLLRIR